tara:strand:- start:260 stop:577 length:318 start_codon:yes stop_codon:yes gene_type:complete
MTQHTEARLAREAEIAYSSLAMVTDYDCWNTTAKSVTVDMVLKNLQINAQMATKIVHLVAKHISDIRPPSSSHTALKDGLMTAKENVPKQTRKKLELLTKPYWGK